MRGTAIIAGVLMAALWGSPQVLAQSNRTGMDFDPELYVSPEASALFGGDQDQIPLGYTLSGTYGAVGHLELGRASFPGATITLPAFGTIGQSQILEQNNIEWNVSPRLTVASGFRRQSADPRFNDERYIEDTFAGGVALSITPRFRVTAAGALALRSDSGSDNYTALTGDSARVGAAYSFLPGLQGSVNYTYQSYDGEVGSLEGDTESTLSLSVTGQF